MPNRSHWKNGGAILAMLAATLTAALPAEACTSFLLRASDGTPVYGRTMEFGFQLSSEMIVIPRQFGLSATGPDGKIGGGMPWQAKYAAVGLNAFDMPVLTDGMNEKGLTGGILYFPDYVGYADPKTADPKTAMAPWDFLTWALTNFATVAEVKEAAKGISIIDVAEPTMGIVPPFHYTLHDATGASLVVEPVGGALKIYDNPLGVMTNAPEFDWHLTNLKNYVKLSPFNAPALDLWGQSIPSFGQGSGLLGMPGDPTPPSRFIRALGYTMTAKPVAPGVDSVRLAEHIANNFDIPVGWIRPDAGDKTPLEFTQWTTVGDIKNLKYYVKTYEDQVLRGVDLMSFDLDAKAVVSAPLKPNLDPPALEFPK
jgi:choloylglycine hydrolase